MKSILLFVITAFILLSFPKANFGQAPNLGTTSGFALFTASGAFDNAGASVITGNIGSFTYSPVGFPIPGTVVGTIYNVGAPILTSAAADVGTAFGTFGANGAVLGTPLETYNTTGFINAGTYHTIGAAALNGDFTLDAQGDPNAIFVINIKGTLTVGAGFNILLKNSASLCNIYWLIDGDFNLGAGSVFRGTVIASGLIELFEASSLLGRGLSTGGAIKLHNNVVTVNAAGAGAAGILTGTASVCKGQTGLVYSVPAIANASTYIWTLPVGATITAGANTNSITVDYSASAASGNITVQGSSSCGTGAVSANFAVTLKSIPAAVAGADRALCSNTGTQIGAAAVVGSTYSWSSVPAGFTSTVANPTVTPLVTTTYTVVETNAAATCTNSHSVVVTLNPTPAAVAGADRAICLNAGTQIGAVAVVGSTYKWSSVPAGFTSTAANPTVTPLVTTTYTVVETNAAVSCTNSHSVVVTLNPTPAAVTGTDRAICLNSGTQIGATAVVGSTYSWNSAPVGFTSTVANPTVTPLVTTAYILVETNTASGCSNSRSVIVTVNPAPVAIAGAARAICLNTSTILGAASIPGSTYSWSSSPAGFTASVANPTVTPLINTVYTVVETITATGCTNSHSVAVTVNAAPAAVAGADRIICLNSGTRIGAESVSGNTYNWSSVPAGFTSTFANPTVNPLVSTSYTIIETNSATGCTNSHSVVVTVNSSLAAIAGADRTICQNASTQIGAATVPGSSYNWSSVPAGFTSNVANPIVTPLGTTTYTVIETISGTSCSNANSIIITVNPLPAAVAGANRAICQNTNTQIGSASVTGSTYIWSSVPAGFTSTSANPTVTPLVNTNYTVVETFTATGCTNSNSVAVTISAATAAVAGADRSICLNESTQIGAVAVAGSTYKWTSIPAGFTSTVANPMVNPLVTTTYTVVETNVAISCQNTNAVTIAINTAPNIITEPIDQTACVGNSASFSVNATGTGLTYQWRKGTSALNNEGNISGATSATLTINHVNPSDVASNYNVVITGACSTFDTSKNASLAVNPAPSISTSVCAGSSVSFSAAATGTGLTYQWRKGDVNLTDGGNISGATSAMLTINPVNTSDASSNYNVLINGACSPDATSLSTSLTVNPALTIVSGPVNQVACDGSAASFSVNALGGGLTYQWRKGEVNISNGGNISGATSATLTINAVSATDVASNYNVVVTGACSPKATSSNAALALCIPTGSASIGAGDTNNVVTIYPNPFTSSLDIKVNDASKMNNYELKVYNILGEEVINTRITQDITTLKTSNLTSGVYLYEVRSNNKTVQSGKLISQQ